MHRILSALGFVAGLFWLAVVAGAQESFRQQSARAVAQTDALDVLGLRAAGTTATALAKRGDMVVVPGPYFGVNPTAGTILGVGMNALFYLGDPDVTPLSTIDNLIAFTSKGQFMFFSKSTVQTDDREWEFQGDWRYYVFSEPTFGLSTSPDAPDSAGGFLWQGQQTTGISGGQELKYDFLRFHQAAFRRVAGDAYFGLGYQLDVHRHIEDLPLALASSPPTVTSHFAYSTLYGYNPTGYVTSGVCLNFLIDSRDDVLHPYRGQYALLSYAWNSPLLGSSQSSQTFYGEYRAYISLDAGEPKQVLGFWAFLNLTTRGALPYLDLPAIGYDQRERSGRGYVQGRWRGDDLAYLETEYRFPLGWNGLLDGVAFANAVTTSRRAVLDPAQGVNVPSVGLFQYVKPAVGAGLRLLLIKDIRMNAEFDYARGVDGSSGLYVNLFETF